MNRILLLVAVAVLLAGCSSTTRAGILIGIGFLLASCAPGPYAGAREPPPVAGTEIACGAGAPCGIAGAPTVSGT